MTHGLSRKKVLDDGVQSGYSDAPWRTSSFCGPNGPCVEFAELPGGDVGVRDSKDPASPVLRFTPEEWRAFIAGAVAGEFSI
ncbi:MAG: DUF397 domain-containing protein [Streptosporangiaceae bacterium]